MPNNDHIRATTWGGKRKESYYLCLYIPKAAQEMFKGAVNKAGQISKYLGTDLEVARDRRDAFLGAMSRTVAPF